MKRFIEIGARDTKDGLGFELYNLYFGLTCSHETFHGHYDLWPFCKPYDAEEWWSFMEKDEANRAALDLTAYLKAILPANEPPRMSPPRVSFAQDGKTFTLTNNGTPCGMYLFKGEGDKGSSPWPFGRHPEWFSPADRATALKHMARLQEYLDKRTAQLSKK